jgi:hypothetical protein
MPCGDSILPVYDSESELTGRLRLGVRLRVGAGPGLCTQAGTGTASAVAASGCATGTASGSESGDSRPGRVGLGDCVRLLLVVTCCHTVTASHQCCVPAGVYAAFSSKLSLLVQLLITLHACELQVMVETP